MMKNMLEYKNHAIVIASAWLWIQSLKNYFYLGALWRWAFDNVILENNKYEEGA